LCNPFKDVNIPSTPWCKKGLYLRNCKKNWICAALSIVTETRGKEVASAKMYLENVQV